MELVKDLKHLLDRVEHQIGMHRWVNRDYERLSTLFSKRNLTLPLSALKKTWEYTTGAEKPTKDTLDKLALFAGFQSWQHFQEALHGEADAATNYEDDSDKIG